MANGKFLGANVSGLTGLWTLTDQFLSRKTGLDWNGLYPFTSFTFTNAGATGALGPSLSQVRTAYSSASWAQSTSYLDVTATGIQLWTAPSTGSYSIDAFGGAGGDAGASAGGKGARQYGVFSLTKGEVIKILVGHKGPTVPHSQNTGQYIGSGGGGTFVTKSDNTILLVSGGGGGAANNSWTVSAGIDASTSTSGAAGGGGQTAGGTGGGAGGSSSHAGGSAGFTANGSLGSGTSSPDYAYSFINGGKGGRQALSWGDQSGWGGFGGGGGGGGLAAGGGGGYSGGGNGTWSSYQQGGGGGSINNGSSTTSSVPNTGHGYVIITLL